MRQSNSKPSRPILTDRLREVSAGFIDPIVTILARLRVSPDFLTLLGMLMHVVFAYFIATGQLLVAGILAIFFVPLDALDGALARKLGRPMGSFGAFLDSNADRLAEIILYAGYISFFYQRDDPLMVAAAYAAATGSLMVSYSRSRAEALGISCKVGLFTRFERYIVIVATLVLNIPKVGLIILAIGTYITFFQRAYHVWQQSRQENNQRQ